MFKCKHKRQEEKNCYYEDYHCVEYDIYCKDCGKYLGHWAYGYSDVEENLYFEKWYNRLFYKENIQHLGNDGIELTYKENQEAQIDVLQELLEGRK